MEKIIRLKNNEFNEVKNGVVDRPVEAEDGSGWYNLDINIVDLAIDEPTELIEGYELFSDKVVETIIRRYYVPTLQEVKDQKIEVIKNNTISYVKESNPDLWFPDNISTVGSTHKSGADILITQVNAATTKEEVEALPSVFMTPEEILEQEGG